MSAIGMLSLRAGRLVAAVVCSSAMVCAGNVVVVDSTGGGSFAQIQPAVDATVDGDAILVKSGSYAGFTIDTKSLSVVADSGASVDVAGTITVKDLAASQVVILVRLRATGLANALNAPGSAYDVSTGLNVSNSLGAVRIYSCEFRGGAGTDAPPLSIVSAGRGGHGAFVSNSGDVAFASSVLFGGAGGDSLSTADEPFAGNGGSGIVQLNSAVALFDTSSRGGDAGDVSLIPATPGADGGHGVLAIGSGSSFACNGLFEGGDGGRAGGNHFDDVSGGDGGHGVSIPFGSPVTAKLRDNVYSGGIGGDGSQPFGDDGALGQGISAVGGTLVEYAGSSLELSARTPVREGTTLLLTLRGDPGSVACVIASDETVFLDVPLLAGIRIVPLPMLPARVRKFGPIPTSGVLFVPWPIASLPTGVDVAPQYLQAYALRSGSATIGTFVPVVVLDAAF